MKKKRKKYIHVQVYTKLNQNIGSKFSFNKNTKKAYVKNKIMNQIKKKKRIKTIKIKSEIDRNY